METRGEYMATGYTSAVCPPGGAVLLNFDENDAGHHGGAMWGDFYLGQEDPTCCLSSCFCLAATHHGLSPTAVIACVILLHKKCMENHLSLGSNLFWKIQGQSGRPCVPAGPVRGITGPGTADAF